MPDLQIKEYEIREEPILRAAQWTCETQVEDLIDWVDSVASDDHGWGPLDYDDDIAGALGPDGEDWGCLTLEWNGQSVEVAPFDYVVLGVTGAFFVVGPKEFEAVYRERGTD